jgi:hypothetical protein
MVAEAAVANGWRIEGIRPRGGTHAGSRSTGGRRNFRVLRTSVHEHYPLLIDPYYFYLTP